MLESLGYTAMPAGSGKEALSIIARAGRIDLALVDFAMPDMNGIEIVKHLRIRNPALPVIVVTGYGDLSYPGESGELQVLRKPYQETDLTGTITAVLSKARP